MTYCCVKLVACETIASTHHIKMCLYYVPTCILLLGLTIKMEFIAIFEHSVHMEPGFLSFLDCGTDLLSFLDSIFLV